MFVSDKKAAGVGCSSNGSMFKQKQRPKLERRNAIKNIDYELPLISSSFSDDCLLSSDFNSTPESPAQRTRSLDSYTLDEHTSFRIEGKFPGEFEVICRNLGLSGPEDFAIPAAAWENMKVRSSSSSDVFPRLSRFNYDSSFHSGDAINRKIENSCDAINQNTESSGSKDNASKFSDVISLKAGASLSVNDVINQNIEGSGLQVLEATTTPARSSNQNLSSYKVGLSVRSVRSHNRLRYNHEEEEVFIENVRENNLDSNHLEESDHSITKELKQPPLAPPSGLSLIAIDSVCSTWDILKSFAPDDDDPDSSRPKDEDEGKEEDKDDEEVRRRADGESNGLLLESFSFTTTSNDDDSSSTTMEPFSNISPYGRFRRTISYWEKGELLGRGSFGSVYEGIADGGFFFAVKEVSLLDQGEVAKQSIFQLEQEITLLSQFEHDNIVQYYGTDKDESKLYIFLELVTQGSLLSLYQKFHLQVSQVSAYTRQILRGLKYLHDRNVVHRDIKCANILVDARGSVKLADFGLAKATKLNDVKSSKGTALWMAPEVVNRRNQGYGLAADIWSLGCTVLEMSTGQFPYSHLDSQMAALFRIGKGEPPRVPESLSRDAKDFILQCLQVNPNSRPTASQLLDHPFVQRSLIFPASYSPYLLPSRHA